MIPWNGSTDDKRRRLDRRDLVAFGVAFVAALVVIGSLWLIGAQDANGSTRPTPQPRLSGQAVGHGVKCSPIWTSPKGTLYGCTDGHVRWWAKRTTR